MLISTFRNKNDCSDSNPAIEVANFKNTILFSVENTFLILVKCFVSLSCLNKKPSSKPTLIINYSNKATCHSFIATLMAWGVILMKQKPFSFITLITFGVTNEPPRFQHSFAMISPVGKTVFLFLEVMNLDFIRRFKKLFRFYFNDKHIFLESDFCFLRPNLWCNLWIIEYHPIQFWSFCI